MVLINSCCFFKSLRSGCMVSAVYTLIFYTLNLTAGTFHIHQVINNQEKLTFTYLMLALSVTIILSSIIMMIGIHADNKHLLLPWIIMVTITTITDILFVFYLILFASSDPFLAAVHFIDFVICALNTYCLLCVLSQYQIYSTQSQRHGGLQSNPISEEVKIQCIMNETSTCQFSNSANKDAANSTFE